MMLTPSAKKQDTAIRITYHVLRGVLVLHEGVQVVVHSVNGIHASFDSCMNEKTKKYGRKLVWDIPQTRTFHKPDKIRLS